MMDKDIESLIKQAVEEDTPDILNDLLKETGLSDNITSDELMPETTQASASAPVLSVTKGKRPWRHLYTAILSAAAAVCVFAIALSLLRPALTGQTPVGTAAVSAVSGVPEVQKGSDIPEVSAAPSVSETPGAPAGPAGETAPVFASVCIDVNPSVELVVDTDYRVSSCRAVNEDGRKILSRLELDGTDIATASYALIGVMLTEGYLNDVSNSVLLSVFSDDTKQGTLLEKDLASRLSAYLDDAVINVAILGQYAQENTDERKFAEANGISEGKARIIRELSSSVPKLTEESLLMLSTHELLLIWKDYLGSDNAPLPESGDTGDIISYGTFSTDGYISREDALDAALSDIGADPASASDLKAEFECEDGTIIYDVEFCIGDIEYEAAIDAVTGALLYWKVDEDSYNPEEDEDGDDEYDNDDDDTAAFDEEIYEEDESEDAEEYNEEEYDDDDRFEEGSDDEEYDIDDSDEDDIDDIDEDDNDEDDD